MHGAYILSVSLKGVFPSTFSVRWESMPVQSCDCRNVVGVWQVVRHVRTWSRVRS